MPRGSITKLKCGIYCIKHLNGKLYIGQSTDIPERLINHRLRLKQNKHDNQHLQNAWNLSGEEAFTFEVIITCPRFCLDYWEQYYIDSNLCWIKEFGYNKERYVTGTGPLSEITKQHISEAHQKNGRLKGRKLSDSHRANLKASLNKPETKAKLVKSSTGRVPSDETREKIRLSKLGTTASIEARRNMSEAHIGVKLTEERRLKHVANLKKLRETRSAEEKNNII